MGIFEPFRAIGYINAGGVPFSVQRLGTETFVTVSVGKAFHVYNVSCSHTRVSSVVRK
jgi:U3 small nucleolar RNA-associated protein 21